MAEAVMVRKQEQAQQKREGVETRTISMYPSDWEKVESAADKMGSNVSAVIRLAVREWDNLQQARSMSPMIDANRILLE